MSKEWWQEISADLHLRLLGDHDATQTPLEISFIENQLLLSNDARILDLACGNGRHTNELSKRSYSNVISLDYTQALLAVAHQDNPDGRFIRGDMITLPFENNSFDLIMSLWQSVGYFDTEEKNDQVFSEISRVLKKGGNFVIQVNNPLKVILDLASQGQIDSDGRFAFEKTENVEGGTVSKSVTFDPNEFRYKSTREFTLGDKKAEVKHNMRYYTLPELQRLLTASQITTAKIFGSMSGDIYNGLSKDIVIFGEKL